MESYDPDKRKLLSALCHGACFFSATIVSVGIPIAILAFTDDSVVKANAKEALNFQITIFLAAFVSLLLVFVLVGFILLFVLAAFSLIFSIIAITTVLSEPDTPYRYPIVLRVI
jgi:uncharacterized protein